MHAILFNICNLYISHSIFPNWNSPPSYKAPPTKGHPSYQTRFQMHWKSKIQLNNSPQERPPSYRDTFSWQKGLLCKRGTTLFWKCYIFRLILCLLYIFGILVLILHIVSKGPRWPSGSGHWFHTTTWMI